MFMRSAFVLMLGVSIGGAVSALAADTDRDILRQRAKKYTRTDSFDPKPKRLCVCHEDTTADDEQAVGVLVDDVVGGADGVQRVRVRCYVHRFLSDGSSTGLTNSCSGAWSILR